MKLGQTFILWRRINQKQIFPCFLLLLIAFLLEILVFNCRFYEPLLHSAKVCTLKANTFSNLIGCTIQGDSIKINSDSANFSISRELNMPVYCIKINYSSKNAFGVSVFFTDKDHSVSSVSAGTWYVDPRISGSNYIRISTLGKCQKIDLKFSDMEQGTRINSIEINRPYFGINPIRIAIVFLLLVLIYIMHKKAVWEIGLIRNSPEQRVAIFVILLLAVILSTVLCCNSGETFGFTQNVVIGSLNNDCYRYLTEALSKGHLSYIELPSKDLLNLSNPYSFDLRSSNHIDFLWDSALYNGKYYCYFGIAPVIFLLLPFKLITGFYLPTSIASYIFTLALFLVTFDLYNLLIDKWFKSIPFISYICGLLAILFGSNFIWLIAQPNFYALAETSALFFMFLGIDMIFRAAYGNRKQLLYLMIGSLGFGLMVASRPNLILYSFLAIPFLALYLQKNKTNIKRLKTLITFGLPLVLIGCLLMVYNFSRFGSPFEFGQRYQLTVNDTRNNSISDFPMFFGGLFHYVFQRLQWDLTFPFVHIISEDLDTSSGWSYNQPIAGLINYPLLFVIPIFPCIFKKISSICLTKKLFVIISVLAAFSLIYIDSVMGGALERYTLDIQPMLVFSSIILCFEISLHFKKSIALAVKVFSVICFATVILSTLSCSSAEYNKQEIVNPTVYHYLCNTFEFWR